MPDDSPRPESSDSDPWIGQTLAGYIFLRRIGEGGMGVVYLARHQSLDRLAAVKFLPAEMAHDEAFIQLFLREAKAAAKLSHPNIVDVHDAGVAGDNIYYFIMEYVEGRDLHSIQEDLGTMPASQAAEYIRQAASALAYAHKKKIIHRDIKPENLLLTHEGVIKVVDLGLAKWAGEEASALTQTGDIMGSPIYISPERLRDPNTVDPRLDIYSLGGTFFHLVTGKIPYEGSSPVIMARHLTDPVPDPRDINPDLDDELAKIIMKMMAKDARDRYQSMDEVEAALKNYLAGPPSPEAGTSSRKLPAWMLVAGGMAIATIAAVFLVPAFAKINKGRKPLPAPAVDAAPKTVAPRKAVETAPAKPATPALLVANFNSDSRQNKLNGTFGSWASSKPQPIGRSNEKIDLYGGSDGSGCWRIDFDITNAGSFSGAWMQLRELNPAVYDTLAFHARVDGSQNLDFIVELKTGTGSSEKIYRYVLRDIGQDWIRFELPLGSFNLPPGALLAGMNIVFDKEVTGPRKGTLLLDNLEFLKKR